MEYTFLSELITSQRILHDIGPNDIKLNVMVPLYPLMFLIYIVLSMPWPAHIVTMFESIPADEAVLYGPINMLLVHLFPPTDLYIVSPQWKKPSEGFSIDFTTVFVVQNALSFSYK